MVFCVCPPLTGTKCRCDAGTVFARHLLGYKDGPWLCCHVLHDRARAFGLVLHDLSISEARYHRPVVCRHGVSREEGSRRREGVSRRGLFDASGDPSPGHDMLLLPPSVPEVLPANRTPSANQSPCQCMTGIRRVPVWDGHITLSSDAATREADLGAFHPFWESAVILAAWVVQFSCTVDRCIRWSFPSSFSLVFHLHG